MKNLGLGVLELFADVQRLGQERLSRVHGLRVVSKQQDNESNAARMRLNRKSLSYRNAENESQRERRKAAMKKPKAPVQVMKVAIFWDGDGWYYAQPRCSMRLAGPFDSLHKAWKSADKNNLEVERVDVTRGERSYRP